MFRDAARRLKARNRDWPIIDRIEHDEPEAEALRQAAHNERVVEAMGDDYSNFDREIRYFHGR
jgi:hypothetical protein